MAFVQKEKFFKLVRKCGADSTCNVAAGSLVAAESASVIVTLLEGNHYLVVTGHMLEGQRS